MSPTHEQTQALTRNVGAVRFAQNEMLQYVKENLETGTKISWTYFSLIGEWGNRREEVAPWHQECSSRAYLDGCNRLATSLKNWNSSRSGKRKGQKVGFPHFRRRGSNDSWTFCDGYVSKDGLSVQVPRIGKIKLAERLDIPENGRVTTLNVRSRAGRWFVSARVREDSWIAPEKKTGNLAVGIDLGISDRIAVMYDSNGKTTEIENPRFFRSDEDKIAKASRNVSKKKKGSKNREKARKKLSVVHYRVACRRQDFLHKFTTDLVKTHDQIVLEDLNVKGMSSRKGFKLGKSVNDAAMSEIRRQVTYKCEWYGTELIIADRWYASSKNCSGCGTKNTELTLGDREWCCSTCGMIHDRDKNAAKNLMNLAGSSSVSACGADVSQGSSLQSVEKQENPNDVGV